MNSMALTKMHGSESESGFFLPNQESVQKMDIARNFADTSDKTDQASGMEKVLAQSAD